MLFRDRRSGRWTFLPRSLPRHCTTAMWSADLAMQIAAVGCYVNSARDGRGPIGAANRLSR